MLNDLILPLIAQLSWRVYILKAKHQRLLKQVILREVLFLTDNPCSRQVKEYEAIFLGLGGVDESPMEMIIDFLEVR